VSVEEVRVLPAAAVVVVAVIPATGAAADEELVPIELFGAAAVILKTELFV